MPKLDLVYVGRFTIKDLDANSRYKFDNKELSIEDIDSSNLIHYNKKYLDRCAYAYFTDGKNKKILKTLNF
jgi:hypothetical protein